MSFTLKIMSGKAEGKEFSFTKKRVTIGRLPENDLVLYDTGVSRKHCEIVNFKPGKYGVQDLGSSNGTRVNDLPAKKTTLKNGDVIQIGPVAFAFTASDNDEAGPPEEAQRYREAPRGMVPDGTSARKQIEQVSTVALEPDQVRGLKELRDAARQKPPELKPKPEPKPKTGEHARPAGPKPGDKAPGKLDKPATKSDKPTPHEPENTGPEHGQLTQRRAGLTAWRLAWMRLGKRRRPIVAGAAAAGGLLLLIVLIVALKGPGGLGPDYSGKVFELNATSGSQRYGFGNVDVQCWDKVTFSFNYSSGLAILHYAVGGTDSPDEVVIYVNGKKAGSAPLATSWIPDLRLKLPRESLKPNAPNLLTFDNTRNPPGSDRWGVQQIEIEQKALPPPDLTRAIELFTLGQNAHKAYLVDPANLSQAIEKYSDALLFLEALDPKPPLYQQVSLALEEAEAQLSKIIEEKTFIYFSEKRRGNFEAARQVLMDLLQYLPNVEDDRRQDVINKLRELGSQ